VQVEIESGYAINIANSNAATAGGAAATATGGHGTKITPAGAAVVAPLFQPPEGEKKKRKRWLKCS
jgi:hypothetical protein